MIHLSHACVPFQPSEVLAFPQPSGGDAPAIVGEVSPPSSDAARHVHIKLLFKVQEHSSCVWSNYLRVLAIGSCPELDAPCGVFVKRNIIQQF